jgi:aminoglycoside N3'-acetyltransferase
LASTPLDLIRALRSRLGESGTLVMPRYSWHLDARLRPWQGYRDFLQQTPVVDLRATPANIGAVPEAFRTLDGIVTSTSYFWPVCAVGGDASAILSGQEAIVHPYGPGSTFCTLLERQAKVVGLGVTLNTTSIAPVTDYVVSTSRHHPVFTSEPVSGTIIDLQGRQHATQTVTLKAEYVRDVRPSIVLTESLEPGVDYPYFTSDSGAIFFAYPAQLYHRSALAMAQAKECMPWFSAEKAVENLLLKQ